MIGFIAVFQVVLISILPMVSVVRTISLQKITSRLVTPQTDTTWFYTVMLEL